MKEILSWFPGLCIPSTVSEIHRGNWILTKEIDNLKRIQRDKYSLCMLCSYIYKPILVGSNSRKGYFKNNLVLLHFECCTRYNLHFECCTRYNQCVTAALEAVSHAKCGYIRKAVCCGVFFILATSKDISGRVLTYDNAYSWQLHSDKYQFCKSLLFRSGVRSQKKVRLNMQNPMRESVFVHKQKYHGFLRL